MDNKNYTAFYPNNLRLGSDILFYQHCIFNGQGRVTIGDYVDLGYQFSPHFYGFHILMLAETKDSIIEIGSNTAISNDVSIRAMKKIKIGDNCLIGDRVTILDSDMHEINPYFRRRSIGKTEEVNIGDNVWVGSGATILKGVTIGENSIVAAGSVVTKSVPKNSIVMGNPANVVKINAFPEEKDDFIKSLQFQIKDIIKEYIENNELNKAKIIIKQYDYLLKSDIEIYSIKSIIFIKEKNYDRAEEIIKTGLEIDEKNFDMMYNLAFLYEEKSELNLSKFYYLSAIEVCKEDSVKNEIINHIQMNL